MTETRSLRDDIPAGIVVTFVAIPLCLGIALASGAPLFAGLIAGVVGGIIVGAVSKSPLGVSGPAAGLAVIVLTAISELGSYRAFLVAVVLAGVIQIALGVMRAGVLAYFFPSSVIKGMLSGIGLLIILKQIPHAVGWDADVEADERFWQADGENTFSEILQAFSNINLSATAVAIAGVCILLLWEKVLSKKARVFQLIQGPLVVVGGGIAFVALTNAFAPEWAIQSSHLVNVPVVDTLSGFADLFVIPDWSQLLNGAVLTTGVTIAIVASLETLLCVDATDRLDPEHRVTPTNRELIAQGIGNICSGMIGGIPVTQVIVRSSANIQSGAKSKVATIVHGVVLFALVILTPKLLNLVPLSSLAAVLLVVGYKLSKPSLFREMWNKGRSQSIPFVATIAGVVLIDLLSGVVIGMAIAVLFILHENYQRSFDVDTVHAKSADDIMEIELRFAEHVTFLSRGAILRELGDATEGARVHLDLTRTTTIDYDVEEIIQDFKDNAPRRGIVLRVSPPMAATTTDVPHAKAA